MATYIKTLKEDNDDIIYPQTKAEAVLLTNGSDLETEMAKYVTAEDIASTSALAPPVQTNMIADGAVTDKKIDWTTIAQYGTFATAYFNASSWTPTLVGGVITVPGLVANATYKVSLSCQFTELMNGEVRLVCTGASTRVLKTYTKTTAGLYGFTIIGSAVANSSGVITLQRAYSGEAVTNGRYGDCEWFVERIA